MWSKPFKSIRYVHCIGGSMQALGLRLQPKNIQSGFKILPLKMGSSIGNCSIIWLLALFYGTLPFLPEVNSEAPEATKRTYPWCLTVDTLVEYQNDLAQGASILGNLLTQTPTATRSKCPSCPVGKYIDNVNFFRIKTNLLPIERWSIFQYLRQWIHIHVPTKVPLKGLLVQANVAPYGMAYGNFDLEFGCKDCGDGVNLAAAKKGKALELGGNAAAIPCRRRSYLHLRHPNVYAYANKLGTEGISSFHMNYRFLDITCRKFELVQFMFLMVPLQGDNSWGKTSVIDHVFLDSIDGMPYPYHVDFYNQFSCHVEKFDFQNAGNGEKNDLTYLRGYDDCILASKAKFHSDFRDTGNFMSNKVCKWPPRSKCDYLDPANVAGSSGTQPGKGNSEVCTPCDEDDNSFTREAYKRLIRRTYKVRRVHGVAMIFGMIALGVVTIHVARYLKETGGGCLLVGWWLWAHFALSHAAKGAVYIGLVLVLCQPGRETTDEAAVDIETKRVQLIWVHKIVGAVAVALLHVECMTGPIRPSSPMLRMIVIILHAVIGYLSILISFVAVIFSTACFDVVLYTSIIMIISLIAWIVGMVLHILMDAGNALKPGRKLFPVIEAVKVIIPVPMMIPRLALLAVMVIITLVMVLLMGFKGGYVGLFVSNACINCIWKYDDTVILDFDRKITTTEPMYNKFNCTLRDGMWDSLLSLPRA